MFWLALIIAATLLANVVLRRLWLPLIGVGVWMAVGVVIISIVPGLMQRYVVEPNELTRAISRRFFWATFRLPAS